MNFRNIDQCFGPSHPAFGRSRSSGVNHHGRNSHGGGGGGAFSANSVGGDRGGRGGVVNNRSVGVSVNRNPPLAGGGVGPSVENRDGGPAGRPSVNGGGGDNGTGPSAKVNLNPTLEDVFLEKCSAQMERDSRLLSDHDKHVAAELMREDEERKRYEKQRAEAAIRAERRRADHQKFLNEQLVANREFYQRAMQDIRKTKEDDLKLEEAKLELRRKRCKKEAEEQMSIKKAEITLQRKIQEEQRQEKKKAAEKEKSQKKKQDEEERRKEVMKKKQLEEEERKEAQKSKEAEKESDISRVDAVALNSDKKRKDRAPPLDESPAGELRRAGKKDKIMILGESVPKKSRPVQNVMVDLLNEKQSDVEVGVGRNAVSVGNSEEKTGDGKMIVEPKKLFFPPDEVEVTIESEDEESGEETSVGEVVPSEKAQPQDICCKISKEETAALEKEKEKKKLELLKHFSVEELQALSSQASYTYEGIPAKLLIQENPVDGPNPIIIKNFGTDDVDNDIYTWQTFIALPKFGPRLTDDPRNLQFLFEFGQGIISPKDGKKLCHKRWAQKKIDILISLERKNDKGCGQMYIACDAENAHYECFLSDIVLAISEYTSHIQVHLHLRELSYHTQRVLVVNDQKWLKNRIDRIGWDKTREEMEVKLKRNVTEQDTTADVNNRQSGNNFVDYGICSARNSHPDGQWMTEAQEEGLCTPILHSRSFEPNQKKNFKELSDLLREIKCLKWLKDEDGNYVPPISYFEDDTSAASQFHPDNVWHSYRAFLSFQKIKKSLQLCGCHGDKFNSKDEGRKIVFSFSHFLFKGVREGLIGYMREGIENSEEKLPLYKTTNDRIYDLYRKTPSYLLDLVVQTLQEAETIQDSYVGFWMKRSKPSMDHTGFVQPLLHTIILLTTQFNINCVGLLGICLSWIRDPESAYYMCAAGAMLLNQKEKDSDFLSELDSDPYLFSFYFVMLTDRVIEECNYLQRTDLRRLDTYMSQIFVDKNTGRVVIPQERCRIHFGKNFHQWKVDINYLFIVCGYISRLFQKAPTQKIRHTVGAKMTELLTAKMGSCGRLCGGHFVTLLCILGYLPMHFKDCKRADKTSKQIEYFDRQCQTDAGLPESEAKSLGITKNQQELDAFMKRISISLTKKIKKPVTEGRMEQVVCKLYQEHISKKPFWELYLTNQMFVKTDDLQDPCHKIELLLPSGEILPLKTTSLFGHQMPFNGSYVTFQKIVKDLPSIFPIEEDWKMSSKNITRCVESKYMIRLNSDPSFRILCQTKNGCKLGGTSIDKIPKIEFDKYGIDDELMQKILTEAHERAIKLRFKECPIEELIIFDKSRLPWRTNDEGHTIQKKNSSKTTRRILYSPKKMNVCIDFQKWKVADLRHILCNNNLSVAGNKTQLVERCNKSLLFGQLNNV